MAEFKSRFGTMSGISCPNGGRTEKDVAEKALEAYDDVFCDIVNVLLFGGKRIVREEELSEATPLSVYKDDGGHLHEQERDISKFWKDGRIRICLYGLENQTDRDPDMPLRVISYDGAGYRAQLLANGGNKDSNGHKVRYPVLTMVLYFGVARWNRNRSLLDRLDVPEELKPYVSDYRINVFEIAWLEDEDVDVASFRSGFRIVADYFVKMRRDKTYEPTRETIRHVHELLQLMAVLTKDRRFVDMQLPPDVAEGETTMCEVLDRYWNGGLAAGKEEGLVDGILTSLKNLIANTGMTREQAMAALGIAESERDKYASLLAESLSL